MPEKRTDTLSAKLYFPDVWVLRVIIGAIFIFSGFVKAVDPWGFIYKIREYLEVWDVAWVSRESVTVAAITLAASEFTSGVLLLTGCLRRTVVWFMLLMMSFMLPLTLYIYIFQPVADCGCFGDAFVISNAATFFKNVVITLSLLFLLKYNHKVGMIYQPMVQWLVIVASVLLCITLSIVGYNVQPLADFRHYPVGGNLIDDSESEVGLIYERDGVRQEFGIDDLPDSTWTYVGRTSPEPQLQSSFAIYDGDDEVTADVIDTTGPQLLLMVSDPGLHTKARSGMANALNAYIHNHGGSMIGIVAASGDELQNWMMKANPDYEVYSADDTTIKEIVRGNAGLVYVNEGKIVWKRNLYSLPADFPDFSAGGNQLDTVEVVDSGTNLYRLIFFYFIVMFVIYLFGLIKLRKVTGPKVTAQMQAEDKNKKAADKIEQDIEAEDGKHTGTK